MRRAFRHVIPGVATLALLAGCGASGTAGGGTIETAPVVDRFTYGPFSATYEGVSHGMVDQMGQTVEFGLRYYLTAGAVAAGGAHRLSITIDSIPELSGPETSQADAEAAAGTTFTGILLPHGEILEFHGADDTENTFLRQLRTGFLRFFPHLPEDGATPGNTWTDSLQTTQGGDGVDIAVETVTRSEAVDWVEWNGVRALHLVRVSDYTLSGAGSRMGTEFTVDGTGTRHEHRYLAADGTYLGGTAADTSNATALVTAMGMEIPILQIQNDTLRIVR
jgi:hypothetical protein